jgi:signal transduction histidine kinase
MSKSLRLKIVMIMLLLILLLMTVACVFLIRGVQGFFTDQFFDQMESFFSDEEIYTDLTKAASINDEGESLKAIEGLLEAYKGSLGIDTGTRNYYILDGETGAYRAGSNEEVYPEKTPNVLKALTGNNALMEDSNAEYMDVAVPVSGDDTGERYIISIYDTKQTVQDLNKELITLIIQAVLIGFVMSAVLSLILSRTLLQPILGMTKAAEAMAGGDFSRKITVESNDEIGILADTFNNMACRLESTLEEIKKSEAVRREFVANVSHELRTPLTSIKSYAETLTDFHDIPKEMEVDFLHVILNESDRMTKIVQDLLDLSRFDAGRSKFTYEKFSLEKSVRDVYDAIALEAKKRGHEINLELEWKLPLVRGDRARVEQVLINILTNAVKYTPDGGKIDIYSGKTGENVWVKISDTGIGIPQDDLPRVFDRFYRVDKARSRESGGTGLGLSIAKEIAEMHGGNIFIESVPGKGTTVTVVLPIEGPAHE